MTVFSFITAFFLFRVNIFLLYYTVSSISRLVENIISKISSICIYQDSVDKTNFRNVANLLVAREMPDFSDLDIKLPISFHSLHLTLFRQAT